MSQKDIAYELSSREVNIILDALLKEYKNIQRRSLRPSIKAIQMSEVNRIRNKLVSQELKGTEHEDL